MQPSPFGSPRQWRDDDLIAVSRDVDAEMVLEAYRSGVFPMPVRRRLMGWWSPLDRGVLPLDGLRVTRSLRKVLGRYEIRVDTDFAQVLARCANPKRPGSWIDARIRDIYTGLHQRGVVHSVEAWTPDGVLAGGLYGVSLGGLFAGESMFHDPVVGRDASKVALVALVERLRAAGGTDRLLDVQWRTDHLATLGVVEIDRADYLSRLARALELPAPPWPGSGPGPGPEEVSR
ncbi:leucyl/phenylalanyl-tRNA--protein transferase [Microlunatus aurantiacus]|uniref:Leucyl/phenylalanyl-tRNA--protein transferase n=1 Tax=Microlunatus aurantiacus TaxID=446786 RepID=A0ABP7DCB9_9ACTN